MRGRCILLVNRSLFSREVHTALLSHFPLILRKKISPYLVQWNELTEEVKEWDRLTVRGMPEIMKMAGFEIYRM